MTTTKTAAFLKSLGPGLLFAGAAIGVSHLVQSTRAGADGGFALAGVILFALVLKYPFFEFGPRYAAATGESLIEGYRRVGTWALWLYVVVILLTVVITHAAIVLFTSSLLVFAFGSAMPLTVVAAMLYAGCMVLLVAGRFNALDWAIKIVLVVLVVSTVAAAAIVVPRADIGTLSLLPWPPAGSAIPFAFVLALAGWMPSDVAISGHSSLWTLAKIRAGKGEVTPEGIRMDFVASYVATGVLAFAFLTLGAAVMYGSGAAFSSAGTVFSTQLVDMYASTLGPWTRPIVLAAAVTAMFSTTLAIIDGYPRVIDRAFKVLRDPAAGSGPSSTADAAVSAPYWIAMTGVGILTIGVLQFFVSSLTGMVDFVTTVAFLTGPVLGFLNLRVITSDSVPEAFRPGRGMRAFSWMGLAVLGLVAAAYLVSLLG